MTFFLTCGSAFGNSLVTGKLCRRARFLDEARGYQYKGGSYERNPVFRLRQVHY
jgi:hypothetical protein